MDYACPVCSTPQADGEHLANHLAFTALLHGGDHGAWLDANVPDWSDRTPQELATAVTPLAEETSHEVSDAGPIDGERTHPGGLGEMDRAGAAPLDPETRRIVEEAREMTRRMRRPADETEGREE